MDIHIRNGQVNKEVKALFLSVSSAGKKKRGAKQVDKKGKTIQPGRRKRWCPFKGCSRVYAYLASHLKKRHKMKKTSTEYHLMLKVPRAYGAYGGLSELEGLTVHSRKMR